MEEFPLKDECYRVIGACMEVHNELGNGFLEAVYEEALVNEFISRKIPFKKETRLDVYYKGIKLEKYYVADFICFGELIIEIKAGDGIIDEHISQVLNYLKATNLKVGLLVNFGTQKLQTRRVIR